MIRIQEDDFDMAAEYRRLRGSGVGAIVTFTGLVRDFDQWGESGSPPVETLHLQHYPGLTEKKLEEIIREAHQRWSLADIAVIHRVGTLQPGDPIVFVGVAAAHRGEAFAAAEFVMDYLKTRATLWKKITRNGESQWLDMKDSDRAAAERWAGGGAGE